MRAGWLTSLIVLAATISPASGHEVRPAYLELRELPSSELEVFWKTPAMGEMRLAMSPVLSGASEVVTPIATRRTDNAVAQNWRLKLTEPLRGRLLRVDGLSATMTDVLVRVEFADGASWVSRLTPRDPGVTIPEKATGASVPSAYVALGVEHIAFGVDHLLFVFALLLITHGTKRLVMTITAFTAAHSITLALATLGVVVVPSAPVEAVIALSIVFVAAEILRERRGEPSLTSRAPWIVAFTFGLLHGFGFAGALAEIGLPEGQIALALLCFNVGVELGQLLFIAVILAVRGALRRTNIVLPGWADLVPPYAVGSVAVFWVIQRCASFR